jgi:hypothetical protein
MIRRNPGSKWKQERIAEWPKSFACGLRGKDPVSANMPDRFQSRGKSLGKITSVWIFMWIRKRAGRLNPPKFVYW